MVSGCTILRPGYGLTTIGLTVMNSTSATVRDATAADIPAIAAIYNEAVVATVATMDTEPASIEKQTAWFNRHGGCFPALVCETGGRVAGWASLTPWSDRAAYSRTVEASVYIEKAHQGRGLGSVLLNALVERATAWDYHVIVAQIAETNSVSLRLVDSFGFYDVGTLREVGYKFGEWVDVRLLQLTLPCDPNL